jgi:hypothetical protein
MSDIEGKVTRAGASKPGGERVSIKKIRSFDESEFANAAGLGSSVTKVTLCGGLKCARFPVR